MKSSSAGLLSRESIGSIVKGDDMGDESCVVDMGDKTKDVVWSEFISDGNDGDASYAERMKIVGSKRAMWRKRGQKSAR